LSYIQGGSADIWKENMMEDLKRRLLKYKTVGKFLTDIRREFRKEDEESVKVVELQKLEQENKTMEEFVQKFKRAARGGRYKECFFIEEFKQGMNRATRKKLMEIEY